MRRREAGAPKAAITASPANFSTVPPNRSTSSAMGVVEAVEHVPRPLGVVLVAGQGRGAHQVGEDHRRELPLLAYVFVP